MHLYIVVVGTVHYWKSPFAHIVSVASKCRSDLLHSGIRGRGWVWPDAVAQTPGTKMRLAGIRCENISGEI